MERKTITIIVPVFRNEGSLHSTYINLLNVLNDISNSYEYEIIFVNDGSDDTSLNELLKLKKIDKKIKILDLVRNFGQVSAIHAGFEYAHGDIAVNLSADMQDPPQLILEMLNRWEDGYKVILCSRDEREDHFIAKMTSGIFYAIMKRIFPKMPSGGFDFFMLDKIVYKRIFELNERNSFMQGDILWTGYEPCIIPYKRLKRTIGKSQWTLAKKLKYFIDGIINTTYLPIRLMSLLGFVTSLLGFAYSVVILIAWFYHRTPFQGYPPIMMGILILFGVTMMMLGIIGEYLWRIYDEVRKRPRYLIKNEYLD